MSFIRDSFHNHNNLWTAKINCRGCEYVIALFDGRLIHQLFNKKEMKININNHWKSEIKSLPINECMIPGLSGTATWLIYCTTPARQCSRYDSIQRTLSKPSDFIKLRIFLRSNLGSSASNKGPWVLQNPTEDVSGIDILLHVVAEMVVILIG